MPVIVVDVDDPANQVIVEDDGGVITVDIPSSVTAVTVPDVSVIEIEVGVVGPQGPAGPSTIPFSRPGNAVVMTGTQKLSLDFPGLIQSVRARVANAPTGSSLIVDIHKNGTTIYTTQANRPTIAAGTDNALGGVAANNAFVSGDYLTVDIDQIGSTLPGTELTITITLERTG